MPKAKRARRAVRAAAAAAESRRARRTALVAGVVAGLLVLVVGMAYTAQAHRSYASEMSFVLSPRQNLAAPVRAGLIESFANSSAAGTYVELLVHRTTPAGPGVSVAARAVPDTRVINLTAAGPREGVVRGLHAVAARVLADQSSLSDLWLLSVLGGPSAPALTGTSRQTLAMVTMLLALLAGAAAFVGLTQVATKARQ